MVTGKWFPHPIDEPEFFAFVTGWREVEEADHHLLPAEVVVLVGVQDPEQVSRIFCRVTWNNKTMGQVPEVLLGHHKNSPHKKSTNKKSPNKKSHYKKNHTLGKSLNSQVT